MDKENKPEVVIPEIVKPLGYEEGKRIHEQMGDDFLGYLTAELGMFKNNMGYADKSAEALILDEFIKYVIIQWNWTKQ